MKSLRSTLLIASALLSGLSIQSQTPITTPGQTTNGPCSPIFNGSNNVLSCNYPPAARFILLANAKLAIAELQKLPGLRVEFTFVGGTDEITNFGNTVAALFREGQWTAAGFNSVGQENNFINGHMDHGEGVRCSGTGQAFETARNALALAGFPCVGPAYPAGGRPNPNPPDVYVQIGSRIMPAD
jgi:hypothetical protein